MSTKRSKHSRASAESIGTPKAIRLGVDHVRVMPEIEENDPQTGATFETPKAIKLGVDLARKLFHRSQDEHPDTPRPIDRIFFVHATNEQLELYRRRTEEDMHRARKREISRPMISPPAPDATLMHRYKERQADWKKRSIALKSKHFDGSRVKRWSFKTWKSLSSHEPTPETTSPALSVHENTVKLLPVPLEKRRSAASLRERIRPARERAPEVVALRSADMEIAVRPSPQSSKKKATSLREQRWAPLTSPTTLEAISEQPTPTKPTHRHANTAVNVPRQSCRGPQMPKKSASMGMLRPPAAHTNNLTIPTPPGVSSISNNQQHIYPALRTQRSASSGIVDERNIHPALRTQPLSSSGRVDEAQIHPGLRAQLGPSFNTVDRGKIQPHLRGQPSISSTSFWRTEDTNFSARPTSRVIPQVRIIPPSTVFDAESAAFAERAIIPSRPPSTVAQISLIKSLNATRATVSSAPLDLHPLLSNHAQDYVALHLPPLPPPKPTHAVYRRHRSLIEKHCRPRATKIEAVDFNASSGASAIRLISPPALGALACGELWAGGKYKRHKTVKNGQVPGHHRFTLLPDFALDPKESLGHVVGRGYAAATTSWCDCAEYDAWVTITDRRWMSVGVGKAEDGRWVVELWEPEGGAGGMV